MRPLLLFTPRRLCRIQSRRCNATHATSLQRRSSPASAGAIDHVEPNAVTASEHVDTSTSLEPDADASGWEKEQSSAQCGAPGDTSSKSRQGHNKTEKHLESLRAGGSQPTLDDLLRLKPARTFPPSGSDYADAYKDLVHRLCNTFSKSQLIGFGKQLKLDPKWVRGGRRKFEYAQSIIEKSWGWENLREAEKKREYKEVISKSFPMSASELFLFLGRDGSTLHQLSIDYRVNISVQANPLSLRIRGTKRSLEELAALIAKHKMSIVSEPLDIPSKTQFSPSLLQQISRFANAYVENVGPDTRLLVYATDKRRLDLGKRLVTRALYSYRQYSHVPLFALVDDTVPSSKMTYSLFPFHPHRQLPWTIVPGNTFRSRSIVNWLNDAPRPGNLSSLSFEGSNARLTDINGSRSSLKALINSVFSDLSKSVITASPGHILISEQMQGGRSRILPLSVEHTKYSDYLHWLRESNSQRIFLPGLPSPLHGAQPSNEKIVHRLTYHAIPDTVYATMPNALTVMKSIVAETSITEQKPAEVGELQMQESMQTPIPSNWQPSCLVRQSSELLVALPNRPMDVNLTLHNNISSSQIEEFAELNAYFIQLRNFLDKRVCKNSEAPLFIRHGQDTYVLHSSASVRQSVELVNVQNHLDFNVERTSTRHISTITESITDLDTAYKTVKCEISCNTLSSTEAWRSFLRDLDVLTSLGYKPGVQRTVFEQ